jgi:hypothetical protein
MGQVRDSVVIHKKSGSSYFKIRRSSDSLNFSRYSVAEGMKKFLVRDTLIITQKSPVFKIPDCFQTMEYIGEFITTDSIRIIDFVELNDQFIRPCFDGICRNSFRRNDLPTILSLTICSNNNDIQFAACTIYIVKQKKILSFEITGSKLSSEIRNVISSLRPGDSIYLSNVKVDTPDGRRTIDELSFSVID